jgi:hypothetical protein
MTVGVHCRRELEREIAIMQPKIDKLDEGLKEKVGGGGARGRFLTCTRRATTVRLKSSAVVLRVSTESLTWRAPLADTEETVDGEYAE